MSVIYDAPGPRTLARTKIATIAAAVLILVVLVVIFLRLNSRGLFEAERWEIFTDSDSGEVWEALLVRGLGATVRAALVAGAISLVCGLLLAMARISHIKPLRWTAATVIEISRGLPVLLLILFSLLAFGLDIFVAVVTGLSIYNSAVIAEILRAGIQSLPKGQREAGLAIGLDERQTLLRILLPQAVRRMLPSLIAQLVVLLKDTSLGYVVGYAELLRTSRELRDFFGNQYLFSIFVVAAVIYITVNFALSRLAVFIENRGSKKTAGGGGGGSSSHKGRHVAGAKPSIGTTMLPDQSGGMS